MNLKIKIFISSRFKNNIEYKEKLSSLNSIVSGIISWSEVDKDNLDWINLCLKSTPSIVFYLNDNPMLVITNYITDKEIESYYVKLKDGNKVII